MVLFDRSSTLSDSTCSGSHLAPTVLVLWWYSYEPNIYAWYFVDTRSYVVLYNTNKWIQSVFPKLSRCRTIWTKDQIRKFGKVNHMVARLGLNPRGFRFADPGYVWCDVIYGLLLFLSCYRVSSWAWLLQRKCLENAPHWHVHYR